MIAIALGVTAVETRTMNLVTAEDEMTLTTKMNHAPVHDGMKTMIAKSDALDVVAMTTETNGRDRITV